MQSHRYLPNDDIGSSIQFEQVINTRLGSKPVVLIVILFLKH